MTPIAMMTRPSRTLTAAMMPSNRFVVFRFPSTICTPRRQAMSVREAAAGERRLSSRDLEFLQRTQSGRRHLPDSFDGPAEFSELAHHLVDRRVDALAKMTPVVGKEEIRHRCADECAQGCSCTDSILIGHTSLLLIDWLPKDVPRHVHARPAAEALPDRRTA